MYVKARCTMPKQVGTQSSVDLSRLVNTSIYIYIQCIYYILYIYIYGEWVGPGNEIYYILYMIYYILYIIYIYIYIIYIIYILYILYIFYIYIYIYYIYIYIYIYICRLLAKQDVGITGFRLISLNIFIL